MNKKVLNYIEECESWKVAIKNLHWSANNMSQHELCDDIASSISDFEDLVSEVEQSITGKIKLNGFTPKSYEIKSLKGFVEDVISSSQSFLKELEGMGDKYVGIKSECETFIGDMQRKLYLVNFTLKEELKQRLKAKINESMPKNLANHDEVDKFMGRKPKSIKARINQIYRIVKKYGIDSKVYHDENWQAISDYYRAISSLGCEVEMKPCGHISNIDSMQSDGGYCDYAEDGMPRSKQYAIKIMFEDGMAIDGYIKCMAAGTVSDPFSRYDTCIVLWPKSNRMIENRKMRNESINEYGDTPEVRKKMGRAALRGILKGDVKPYQNAINSLNKRKSQKEDYKDFQDGFENENRQIKLSEAELKQVVKEAAMNLIREYGENVSNYIKRSHGCVKKTRNPILDRQEREKYQDRQFAKQRKQIDKAAKVQEENSDIEIKPSKKGTFTAAATKHGKSVQGFANQVLKNKDNYSPAMVKKANFAKNFGGKKK